MDSQATVLCETEKKLWMVPVIGNLWFHLTPNGIHENGAHSVSSLYLSMELMTNREREEVVFGTFRHRYGLVGEFVHNKGDEPGDEDGKPDFVGDHDGTRLGVEVTDIYVPGTVRGRTLQEHEAAKRRIVDRAREKAVQSGLPILRVSVIFEGNLPKGREAFLTEALFQIVKRHCPGLDDKDVELGNESGLPNEFWRLFIHNYADLLKEHYWDYIEPGDVETDFSSQLQCKIEEKSGKIPNYLKHCDRCWLIIAALGDRPSSFYDFTEKVEIRCYTSPFERVFFMHVVSRTIKELNVEKHA